MQVLEVGSRLVIPEIVADDLSADIRTQTQSVLSKIEDRLAEIGTDKSRLLMVHIWLSDMALFHEMTSVWNAWIGSEEPPSRSCVSAQSSVPGALLEVVAVAAKPPPAGSDEEIRRFGMVRGPGRPTMCLALAYGNWFTVCLTPPDCSADAGDQASQILQKFDQYLAEAGFDKQALQTAEIWLKNLEDREAVETVWSSWLGPDIRPDTKIMRADMANPDMLIEIRVTASRSG